MSGYTKNKDGIIKGYNARFDAWGCRLTAKLCKAIKILDGESTPGARWDITREGRHWHAIPHISSDELTFKAGRWTNGYDD